MKSILTKLSEGRSLSEAETTEVFSALLDEGSALTEAQIGAYLFATAQRCPSRDELTAGARALRQHMRAFSHTVEDPVLDTCGTGGSGYSTFNTSTAVALLCAAAGQPVAKHGNRAASSRSGSADVLEVLGFRLLAPDEEQVAQLSTHKFVFLFAPDHHPAAKRVALLRKQLGLRTIFNFLGPLANPAGVDYQLLGVSQADALQPMAETLAALGVRRALVVRGRDGLDELSAGALNDVYEVIDGRVSHRILDASEFGIERSSVEAIAVDSAEQSADILLRLAAGEHSAYREVVLLNAGAALYVAERASSIADGIDLARSLLDSGALLELLERLRSK